TPDTSGSSRGMYVTRLPVSISHRLTLPSEDPAARIFSSGVRATQFIARSCPESFFFSLEFGTSQILTVLSELAVIKVLASGDNKTAEGAAFLMVAIFLSVARSQTSTS